MIPSLLQVRLRSSAGRQFGFWFPLILVWVLLLAISPLLLLALLIVSVVARVAPWRAAAVLWGVLSSLSGFLVDVEGPEGKVLVRML